MRRRKNDFFLLLKRENEAVNLKYTTLVFDLDGTLMDTLDDLFLSANFALKKQMLPIRTKEEVRQFVGNGVKKLIERAVPVGTDAVVVESVLSSFKTTSVS